MKFKPLTKELIKISIDRLTRFKPVCERYVRVFDDILSKALISSDKKISSMTLFEKAHFASFIFNSSLDKKSNFDLNKIIIEDERKIYYLNEEDEICLNSNFDFKSALDIFELDELPLNLKRLKLQQGLTSFDVRQKYSTLYPVSKIILVEGITEEILLIEFAKILGLDFKKEGVYVLGAGGKNQVAKKYYKLIEEIKIPIFVLLDFDAIETYSSILAKLRKSDKMYKIKSGEFEDILSKNLIKNALNMHFSQNIQDSDMDEDKGAVHCISSTYKINGWGEFKKAGFAKIIREYLANTKNPPMTDELKTIIELIKTLNQEAGQEYQRF